MDETNISFYLRTNKIHIFIEALKKIGKPHRICFMLDKTGESLLLVPYEKADFISHKVPAGIYNGKTDMDVSSMKLCRILANRLNWDTDFSYRVPGVVLADKNVIKYDLTKAEKIPRN